MTRWSGVIRTFSAERASKAPPKFSKIGKGSRPTSGSEKPGRSQTKPRNSADEVVAKVREELDELASVAAAKAGPAHRALTEEEVGDLLFAAVNLARFLEIDPEIALKKANQKFSRRFRDMERRASSSGRALAEVPRAEMEAFWDAAKRSEHRGIESTAGVGSKR